MSEDQSASIEMQRADLEKIERDLTRALEVVRSILGVSRAESKTPKPKPLPSANGTFLASLLMQYMSDRVKRMGGKLPASLTPGDKAHSKRWEDWGRKFDTIMRVEGLTKLDLADAIHAAYRNQTYDRDEFCWAHAIQSPDKVRKHFVTLSTMSSSARRATAPSNRKDFEGYE